MNKSKGQVELDGTREEYIELMENLAVCMLFRDHLPEEAEERFSQAQAELSKVQAEWAADQENLAQTQSVLQAKVAELMERRPVIADGIEADDLSEYEALRPTKAGLAVAAVKNGMCQGCGMAASSNKVQQARSGVELIYCGGCGRIMYVL